MVAVPDFNSMTDFKDVLSVKKPHELRVILTDKGRQLHFQRECLESVSVLRKVNDGEWKDIAKGVKTPYTDPLQINSPAKIEYKLCFGKGEAESNIVKVTI